MYVVVLFPLITIGPPPKDMLVPLTVPTWDSSRLLSPALAYTIFTLLAVESKDALMYSAATVLKTTGVPKEIEEPLTVPTTAVP